MQTYGKCGILAWKNKGEPHYVCSSPQNGVIKGLSLSMFAHLQLFVIIRSVENFKYL